MPAKKSKLKIAIAAWEIGRVESELGVKIGGLGTIIEELPPELIKAAAKEGITLETEILSPCFAHYDKTRLRKLPSRFPARLLGANFGFDGYEYIFPDGQKAVYFWDDLQLRWTGPSAVYPDDPQMAVLLYASVCQAMAEYIKRKDFDTIHLHDYHVGLIPFYLGDDYLRNVPVHFTIHNATYQGIIPLIGGGYNSLERINLPGSELFHRYFDFFDNLNLMKACMLKVHQTGGKITTVSGDLEGSWGYAAELRKSHMEIWSNAYAQKGGPPGEVFVPNRHLDLFEKLPVAGITNGMSDQNRPENLPELKADVLRMMQKKRGPENPIFRNPVTHFEMLYEDHNFDVERLHVKRELKRLLHLEAFDSEPDDDVILLTAVGRLVAQKNLGLVASILERTLAYAPEVKFIILASAPSGDPVGLTTESEFIRLAGLYPRRLRFINVFNQPLSRLILAGGDFSLIPSRFEPCGLVDYESSLLGNIVIGRATGGLTKVKHCAYLFEWLDIADPLGEADAFSSRINEAIDTYRTHPEKHREMVVRAMAIDAAWDKSAAQYLAMYRYGLLVKDWHQARRDLVDMFIGSLGDELEMYNRFFVPGLKEYGDQYDWCLKEAMEAIEPSQAPEVRRNS